MPEAGVELPSARQKLVIGHNLNPAGVVGELPELVRLPRREWLAHPNDQEAPRRRDPSHEFACIRDVLIDPLLKVENLPERMHEPSGEIIARRKDFVLRALDLDQRPATVMTAKCEVRCVLDSKLLMRDDLGRQRVQQHWMSL
jgi:hypothetical protein